MQILQNCAIFFDLWASKYCSVLPLPFEGEVSFKVRKPVKGVFSIPPLTTLTISEGTSLAPFPYPLNGDGRNATSTEGYQENQMRSIRFCVLFLMVAISPEVGFCDDSSINAFDNRLAIYLLNEADVVERMEVAIFSEQFNHEGNIVSGEVQHFDILNSAHYRLSVDRKRNIRRTDGVCESAQEGAKTIFVCESVFCELDKCFYRLDAGTDLKVLAQNRKMKVNVAGTKLGKVPVQVHTGLISPFVMVYRPDLAGVDSADLAMFSNARVIEEKECKDGSTEMMVVFASKKAGFRVKFRKDPDWLPEECTFFMNQDEGKANQWPSVDEIKKWKLVGKTVSKWVELDSNWVPSEVVRTFENQGENSIATIKFTNWRFGKDVDESIFDSKQFDVETLSKMDYISFIRAFETK
jgi:hypothetical protein